MFWVQIAVAVVLPILAYMGLGWEDMTSWAALGSIFLEAVKNPVILVSVAVSVWNAVNRRYFSSTAGDTQGHYAVRSADLRRVARSVQ